MKKIFVMFMIAALVSSLSFSALAVSGKSDNGRENAQKDSAQKGFKQEVTEELKESNKSKKELASEKEQLETQYEELLAAGDTEGAEALLAQIQELDSRMEALKAQKKQLIQERFMIVKTLYSDEELQQFNSAGDLIEQMYDDASVLDAGSIIVKNNIIKLEAPAYCKGGRTLIPVRAIAEELGAEVTWDGETQAVTITKDETVVVITLNDTTVYVDGVETQLDIPAELSCGRTYVPLRFLAEAFGLDVDWDSDDSIIDIEDGAADGAVTTDGTADAAGTTDGTADGATDATGTTEDPTDAAAVEENAA